MPKHVIIIDTNLHEHPAVKAWSELRPERVRRVEILKGARRARRKKGGRRKKREVYRLTGVGPEGSAIIAKRCCRATALIERTIYEDILPHLPIPALCCYGFVEEADGEFCWLFLEDAAGEKYSPLIEEHHALATRWLGLMHTSAAGVASADRLPDGGPGRYLGHLRSAHETLLQNLANPELDADDLAILEAMMTQYDVLESRWSELEECCDGMPVTLVHGDFRRKNARIRISPAGRSVLIFDWEHSGWGVPAADLVGVDAATYSSVVRDHWPSLDIRAIQRLANVGRIFLLLTAVDWKRSSPATQWGGRHKEANMKWYQVELSNALQAMQWTN